MSSEFDVYNDPDVINAQFGNAALVQAPPTLTPVGAVTLPGLVLTTPLGVASGGTGANSASGARSNLGAAAKASPAIVAATIPLAKITGGGTDGSLTVNTEGIVTAYVAPT